jgi:hypothetical protein
MRVFAKDVTGQKLVHGFESRPLRLEASRWHVNLLPASVLQEFPAGWEIRASKRTYGKLTAVVPAPGDILVPKLKRDEPRDRAHAEWAKRLGLV